MNIWTGKGGCVDDADHVPEDEDADVTHCTECDEWLFASDAREPPTQAGGDDK